MPMKIGTQMPSFEGATDWISGARNDAEAPADGRATLVHFWSVSCYICKENLPRVADLLAAHGEALRVVAIHMPCYPADTDLDAVRVAATKHDLTEPCAVDNMHRLRDAFQNEHGYVPAYYLFDTYGRLRSYAAGERGLNMIALALERVLATKEQAPA